MESGGVAPQDGAVVTGELLTENAGVELPKGVVGAVVGTLVLDTDLAGMVIMTPGSILDCDGHFIRGSTTQVGVSMADGATVRNCLISGFNTGVGLSASDGAMVDNVRVTNSRIGFYLVNGTANATITGSESDGNEIGFLFEPTVSNVHLEGNTAVRNWRSGFMMGHTNDSVLIGNTVTAGGSGFWITNSDRNQFLNNTVDGASEWFSIGVFEGSSHNLFQRNEVTGGGVAIAVNSRAADNAFEDNTLVTNTKGAHVEASAGNNNTFTGNQVTDNSHVGLWDDTPAAATKYNSNTCMRNKDADSVPDGLC